MLSICACNTLAEVIRTFTSGVGRGILIHVPTVFVVFHVCDCRNKLVHCGLSSKSLNERSLHISPLICKSILSAPNTRILLLLVSQSLLSLVGIAELLFFQIIHCILGENSHLSGIGANPHPVMFVVVVQVATLLQFKCVLGLLHFSAFASNNLGIYCFFAFFAVCRRVVLRHGFQTVQLDLLATSTAT